jgi:hypothetical protein
MKEISVFIRTDDLTQVTEIPRKHDAGDIRFYEERGYYIRPYLYSQSEERRINHLLKEERKRVTSYKKYHIQNGLSHTLLENAVICY